MIVRHMAERIDCGQANRIISNACKAGLPQGEIRRRFRPATQTGEDILKPYKETLDRWLWPDVLRNQDTFVMKAKQAISSYKKAVGEPVGLAELMVFYCECAAGFCNDVGYQDDSYFDALVRMFEQAVKIIAQLPASDRNPLIARLAKVRTISHNFGYGVGDDMDSLLVQYVRK
jgi:hypothetical protein